MRIRKTETSIYIKDCFTNWNMSVHLWLKNYVFFRIYNSQKQSDSKTPKLLKTFLPILCTFIASAIWHGFYPGYFMFFIAAAVADYFYILCARLFEDKFSGIVNSVLRIFV